MDTEYGFILEEGHAYTAPLWIGEFGDNEVQNYWIYMMRYFADTPELGWAYWPWNGYGGTPYDNEGFGILNQDMKTIRDEWRLSDL